MDFCCPERCPELPTGFRLSTQMSLNYLISLVPGERFELPTNGLQNRCSTTELTRLSLFISMRYPLTPTPILATVATFVATRTGKINPLAVTAKQRPLYLLGAQQTAVDIFLGGLDRRMPEPELQLMQCAGAAAQKLDGVRVPQTMKRERPKVDTAGFRPPPDGFDLTMEVAKKISKWLAVIMPEHMRRAEKARDLLEQRRATPYGHKIETAARTGGYRQVA
jgi:hypothetical protein